MSDLNSTDDQSNNRWDDCDELQDPMARMFCRVSKLNDFSHRTDRRLSKLEFKLGVLMAGGVITALNAGTDLVPKAQALFRALGVH